MLDVWIGETMLAWMTQFIVWTSLRLIATWGCLYTLQHVLREEGYHINDKSLLIIAVIFIVGVKAWAPDNSCQCEKTK